MARHVPSSATVGMSPVARRQLGSRAAWRRDLGTIPPAVLRKRHRGRELVTRTELPAFAD